MDKFKTVIDDLKIYKDFVKNREDSEIVLCAVDNLKWLIERAEKVERYEEALKKISNCENWIGDEWMDKRIQSIGFEARKVLEPYCDVRKGEK